LFKQEVALRVNNEHLGKGTLVATPLRKTMAKAVRKKAAKKNKLGVKNSLVNNINARKKSGKSRTKKKSTVDKKSYDEMENNWGRKN